MYSITGHTFSDGDFSALVEVYPSTTEDTDRYIALKVPEGQKSVPIWDGKDLNEYAEKHNAQIFFG